MDTEDIYILRYCRSSFFTFLFFMQKLSGTSSGKNNKSCGIFHRESNIIEFAFFRFFYDFIWILHESAKWLYYLRCGFAAGSLELCDTSQICPWFTKNSLERKRETQLGPREGPAVVPAKIGPVWRRGRPGEVRKMIRNSPATDLWAWLGETGWPAGWTAAPGGGRCWSPAVGETTSRLEQGMVWEGSAGPWEGVRVHDSLMGGQGRSSPRQRPWRTATAVHGELEVLGVRVRVELCLYRRGEATHRAPHLLLDPTTHAARDVTAQRAVPALRFQTRLLRAHFSPNF
jgi:hypothetical protein